MQRLFACVLFLAMSLTQHAQNQCDLSISGRIIDEHDGSALSFANIQVIGQGIATMSDTSGAYSLSKVCPGRLILACSHVGCETIYDTLHVTKNTEHNFYPEHHMELLNMVSINEERKRESVALIETQVPELERKLGQTLGQALEGITGVNNLSTGATISKPIVHGLHSNRLLVMNNGVRQEGQQWGNEHAPEIDQAIADELAVIKGASSVKYGPDAIGGVVIVNPKPMPDSFGVGGGVTLVGQSNGLGGNTSAYLDGKFKSLKAFSWRVQGSLKKLGNVNAPDYYLKNTGVEEWNFSLTTTLADSVKGITAYYSQFNTNLGIFSASHIGNLTDLQRAFEADSPLDSSGFEYKTDRPYQRVEHELSKVDGFLNTGKAGKLSFVYGRQYNLRQEFDRHRGLDSKKPGLQFEIVTHSLDLGWEETGWEKHWFQIGASMLTQKNTYEGRYFIPNFRKWAAGIYVIDQWRLSNKWIVEAGVRFDCLLQRVYQREGDKVRTIDYEYQQPSISVGLEKRIAKYWNWRTNLASAWRPPNVSELYSNGLHHGAATFEIGDTNLAREVSYNASMALAYSNKKIQFETEFFANMMEGFIYLAPEFPATLTIRGAFPTYAYRQTDAILYGLDNRIRYKTLKWLTVESSTSILRARNLKDGSWIALMPADQTSLSLEFDHEINGFKLFATPSIQWVNKQWRVPSNSDYVQPPEAYILTNIILGITRAAAQGETHFNLEINNLFSTQYRSYLNRYRYFADEMGRNFVVRFSQTF